MGFIEDMIGEELSERTSGEKDPMTAEQAKECGERLTQLLATYNAKETFSVGDLVTWKPGLKDRKWPGYGEPCVVSRLFPGNVNTSAEEGSNYFGQPADIEVGLLARNRDFVFFRMDSARLQKCQESPQQ